MKTRYFGETKALGFENRWYPDEEDIADAIVQGEWAKKILAGPDVKFQNGRMSHDVASEALEKSHDTLCAREYFGAFGPITDAPAPKKIINQAGEHTATFHGQDEEGFGHYTLNFKL